MKRVLQIGGVLIGILVVLVVGAGIFFSVSSAQALNRTYDFESTTTFDVLTDEADLAEGERLFLSRGCADCHGEDGAGTYLIDDPALGQVVSTNLTTGGVWADYDPTAFARVMQHGVKPDGTSMIIMPSKEYGHWTTTELAQVYSYIDALEPVNNDLPTEHSLGPIGRVLVSLGEIPIQAEIIEHESVGPWDDVEIGVNERFGEYVAIHCTGCHSENYAGGAIPGEPDAVPASNLTPHADGLADYTYEEYLAVIRTGILPDGSVVDSGMPWGSLANMTDTEIEASWVYLQTLEPVPGN